MTCREKFKKDFPTVVLNVDDSCPCHFGYLDPPYYCPNNCVKCWDREMPDTVEEVENKTESAKPHILDSGDRTEFATGAVRDMREGKGRCDLTPLEVVARLFEDGSFDAYYISQIAEFQKTRSTEYLIAVLKDFAEHHYGNVETMVLEVSKHFEEGAKKYGESNWQKGIPLKCYIDSAVRHYMKFSRGDIDEPHDKAFCWNLMCCIWEADYHKPTVEGVV